MIVKLHPKTFLTNEAFLQWRREPPKLHETKPMPDLKYENSKPSYLV